MFYVNSKKEAFRITSEGARRKEALDGDHQEADTRIFTHALHASSTNDKIVISSPDTDVFMIAIAKFEDIPTDLYMLTGTKNSRRIIDIKRVPDAFFDAYCEIDTIDKSKLFKSLLGHHCFTGCDSISAFCGKGKIKALSVVCKDESFIQAFYNLGQTNELSEETILSLERFVCNLYGNCSDSENQSVINQLRYEIYCQKRVKVETLPPCQNVLRQHMKRSNYQTYLAKIIGKLRVGKFSSKSWLVYIQ